MLEKKQYANGQPVYTLDGSLLTYYFKNGVKKAEGRYENDQMEGEWLFYRETGQLWQVGHFAGGRKNGTWVRYDKENNEEYRASFRDDKEVKAR